MHHRFALLTALVVIPATLKAGDIAVKIDGTVYLQSTVVPSDPVQFTVSTPPDITVALGTDLAGTKTIHIYDSEITASIDAVLSVGKLTITGSPTPGFAPTVRINLLIAAPVTTAGAPVTFPSSPIDATSLRPGLTNFGGETLVAASGEDYSAQAHDFDNAPFPNSGIDTHPAGSTFPGWGNSNLRGLIIEDPRLRRQTVVAIVVSNDICPGGTEGSEPTGRIEAGHILRVAALGSVAGTSVVGGNINAHIIADARDTYLTYANIASPPVPVGFGTLANTTTGFRAIETVTAGNAIRGKVIAYGRRKDDAGNDYPQVPEPLPIGPPIEIQRRLDKFWINRGSIANIFIAPQSGGIDGTGTGNTEGTLSRGGIQNDIESKWGRIYSVRTWGPIGKRDQYGGNAGGDPLAIAAADGVLEVRAEPFASQAFDTTEVVKNFRCEVISGPKYTPATGLELLKVQFPDEPLTAGVVNTITSNGDLGHVKCANLVDEPNRRDQFGRCGIIVRGSFPPSGQQDALNCDGIAHNITIIAHNIGRVFIGHHLKGAIIAHGDCVDPVAPSVNYVRPAGWFPLWGVNPSTHPFEQLFGEAGGNITAVSVGATEFDPSEYPNTTSYQRGFVGGFGPPVDLRPTPYLVGGVSVDPTPTPWDGRGTFVQNLPTMRMLHDPDRWHFVRPSSVDDGGAIDSVIHAETELGDKGFFLYEMTQTLLVGRKGNELDYAPYRPRVEAPSIRELRIGLDEDTKSHLPVRGGMIDGVVWSGLLEYHNGVPDNYADADPYGRGSEHTGINRENDYASIGEMRIARISPSADIWATSIADGVYLHAKPLIFEDMCGEMHYEYVEPSWKMEIGGKLGVESDFNSGDYPYHTHGCTERSPRGLAALGRSGNVEVVEPVIAPSGTVYIRGADRIDPGTPLYAPHLRFEGSIVVNSKWQPDPPSTPDQAAAWRGNVVEGDTWGDIVRDPSWLASPVSLPTGWLTLGPADALHPENVGPFYTRRAYTLLGVSADPAVSNLERDYGGSVGVFPLRVHFADSKPADSANWQTTAGVSAGNWLSKYTYDSNQQRMVLDDARPILYARFYGPIADPRGTPDAPVTNAPVIFESWDTDHWSRVDGVFQVDRTYPIGGRDLNGSRFDRERDLAVTPICGVDYAGYLGLYRMRQPHESDDTQSQQFDRIRAVQQWTYLDFPPVDDFAFYFRLHSDADIGATGGVPGSDGLLDNNDFVVFIDMFFNHQPDADVGSTGGVRGPDGVWDNNDFVVFIDLFFSGGFVHPTVHACDSGLGRGMAGGGGGEGRTNAPQSNLSDEVQTQQNAMMRAVLEQMIANEPAGTRRDQLQQMLDALPPAQP